MWKTVTPDPKPTSSELNHGDVRLLIVTARDSQQTWQHFTMTFGVHTNRESCECINTWPREALRLAREKLDGFEERLDKGG